MKSVFRYLTAGAGLSGLVLVLCLSACQKASPPPPQGAPKFNPQEAKALEAATEKADPVEKYSLGKKFRDGDTVPQSLTNAAVWFRKSAEGGYAKAQYHLGMAYEDGEGVAKDLSESTKWYTRAANQDFAKAQEKLGLILWKGEGAPKNLVEAYKWLSLAAAGGEGKAAKSLKKIELSMTPQQITDAKKLVGAFLPKKEYKKKAKES
jgi:TPR repeat protein